MEPIAGGDAANLVGGPPQAVPVGTVEIGLHSPDAAGISATNSSTISHRTGCNDQDEYRGGCSSSVGAIRRLLTWSSWRLYPTACAAERCAGVISRDQRVLPVTGGGFRVRLADRCQ